jgi:5-methylcytosine-specific restriction protein A
MPFAPATHRVPRIGKRHYAPKKRNRHEQGYTNRWARVSKLFLVQHPLCAECERNGRLKPATVTDHIIPHRGDQELFWKESNWQPLCVSCHNKKSAGEQRREETP